MQTILDLFRGSRPDVTPAQVISGIPILAELFHTFGLFDLSQAQQDSLAKTATWAFALLGADAAVRIGRNVHDGKVKAAALLAPASVPLAGVTISQGVLGEDLPSDEEEYAAAPAEAVAHDDGKDLADLRDPVRPESGQVPAPPLDA